MYEHQHPEETGKSGAWYRTRWGMALIGFAALGVLLLGYEHRIHIPFGNLLVILPLFACIGLHSLMHGGHGGHGVHGGHRGTRRDDVARPDVAKGPDERKDVQP